MGKKERLRFFRKVHVFVKRNALALLIAFSTALTLGAIAISAYSALSKEDNYSTPVSNVTEDTDPNVPTAAEPIVFISPLDTITISKEYAADHLLQDKTTGIWQAHQALDFAAADNTDAKAVYSGTIESVVSSMMEGTIITLKINDNLRVIYKSMAESYVEAGDKVAAGAKIGKVGTNVTEKAEGVHLHLEVKEKDKLVDPNNYFAFGDK
ncbi:MAG: M23 family metallopeptidase [Clostridia bacterium]|nr:M23 family metallopeptidase [Clostridia bacterium]